MNYYGYAGSVLHVNLTNSIVSKEELDIDMAKKFLGGEGISSKLAYDLIKPEIDPLSPENVLVYGVSPFTGTFMPGFPRAGMVSKSPLTGFLAESNTGNSIGPMLKYAGYDHLAITGRAKNPVCLVINNDDVEIKDASDIWGMDTFETADVLRSKLGEEYWTSCIGPAGENLVRFACVVENKHGMLGRTGLGAVAGSKNLKAIAVSGTKGIKVHKRQEFRRQAEEIRAEIAKSPLIDMWRNEGKVIDAYMLSFYQRGVYAKRNYGEGAPETCTQVFTQKDFAEYLWKKYYACFGCPCGCKAVIGVDEGEYLVPDFKTSNPWGTPMLFIECGARDWDEAV
ncbi:MAG: aldehyde ferredoxin oxidoreductase, partial [Dehalococcoidia bacterium]|nr:aldehyde ferredoxin oxidoreductase [Dehalococcoidia bacterium]